MPLPTLLLIDPSEGYKFVKRNDKDIGDQIRELIGCDSFGIFKPTYSFQDCEIYCDETGLLKDGFMNLYSHPFLDDQECFQQCQFGGPRGRIVVRSKKFSRDTFENIFSPAIWKEQSADYLAAIDKAIEEYNS